MERHAGNSNVSTNLRWPVDATGIGCGLYRQRKSEILSVIDKAAVAFCQPFIRQNNRPPQILEIGCGSGDLAVDLWRAGAKVTVCDPEDNLSGTAQELCRRREMKAVFKPAEKLTPADMPKIVDGIVAQRVLHWMSFRQACAVLQQVAAHMHKGAPLWASIAGLDSELGRNYPFSSDKIPLEDRHVTTGKIDGSFGHRATLYSGEEVQKLVQDNGFRIRSVSQTNWGLFNVCAARCG